MANKNFVVQHGLSVGPLSIDAVTGDISTPGNVSITGNLGVSQIAKENTWVRIDDTGTGPGQVSITVDGSEEMTVNTSSITVPASNLVAASGTASSSTTTGALVVVGGVGISENLNVGSNEVLTGDLAVNGGDITTTATTFNLVDATATTVNAFGAAATLDIGATTGTATINNPTLVGTQATQNLYNTVATTLNVGGAASTLKLGATTGTATIQNPTLVGTQATQNLYNTVATTVNAFGAATTINAGNAGGTTNLLGILKNSGNIVAQSTTQSTDINSGALVVKGGAGIAGNLYVGGNLVVANISYTNQEVISTTEIIQGNIVAASGTASSSTTTGALVVVGGMGVSGAINTSGAVGITNATASTNTTTGALVITGGMGVGGSTNIGGNETIAGDLAVNGGDITTTATTFNHINGTATTVNAYGAATAITMGATSGTATIQNPTLVGTQATQNLYNTVATTVNAFGAATALNVGATSGTATLRNPTVVGTQATQNLWNTTATTVNAFGAATTINAGNAGGTTNWLGVFKNSGNIVAVATTESTDTNTGAIVVEGGVGVGGNLYVGANIVTTSNAYVGNLYLAGAPITSISNDYQLTSNSSVVLPTQQSVKGYVDTMHAATFEPTGFSRLDPNTIGIYEFSLDGVTIHKVDQNGVYSTRADSKFATGTAYETAATARTLSIYPVPATGSFTIWQAGIRYQFTTLQKASFTAGGPVSHYFFFDKGVLSSYESISGDYIQKLPFITEVYCDEATNTVVILGEERHGITMDGSTHLYLHTTAGTKYRSGLGITGISANATTYTNTVGGQIWDEDILLALDNQTTNQMLYMSGNTWKLTPATNTYAHLVGGVAQYNLKTGTTYSLADIPVGNYAVMYFTATNCRIHQMMKIMGQKVFTSLASARESAQTEPRDTSLLGLPSPEFLYVGAVIVDRNGQVQTLDNGATFVDLRLINISAGTNSTSAAVIAPASDSMYDPSGSGLVSTNVQNAITELGVNKLNKSGGAMSGALQMNTASGITTDQTTFPLINTTATTVNFAGAATALNVGATTGTATINNPTVVGTQVTQNLWNATATTINLGGAASTLKLGATSGTATISNPTVVGSQTTQALWNTVATTVNAFGAATTINAGNASGTTNWLGVFKNSGNIVAQSTTQSTDINSGALVVKGGAGIAGNLYVGGNLVVANISYTNQEVISTTEIIQGNIVAASGTASSSTTTGALVVTGGVGVSGSTNIGGSETITGDLAVNGGDITTSSATFNLVDATATTVNFAGAATAIDIGATTGTATINNPTVVGTQATQNLWNTTATTLNIGGAASTLKLGATTGTATIQNPTLVGTQTTQNVFDTVATTVNFAGAATAIDIGATTGTATINNPTVVGTQATQNLWNTTATTVNAFGAATALNVGATTGTATIQNPTLVGTQTTQNVFDTVATTVNAFGAATAIDIGATTGTATINNPTVVGTQATQNLWNTTATTVNAFGAATTLNLGAATGTTYVKNSLNVAGTITETSSIAYKENVNPIVGALDAILQLDGVTYDRKDGTRTNEAGLIAEDVNQILPNIVTYNDNGKPQGIQYTKLTAYLIESIKELKREISELKGKI